MNDVDSKLAYLWREWFRLEQMECIDHISCCGDQCFCIFCGAGYYVWDSPPEVTHDNDCIYIRAKAIIDQEKS